MRMYIVFQQSCGLHQTNARVLGVFGTKEEAGKEIDRRINSGEVDISIDYLEFEVR